MGNVRRRLGPVTLALALICALGITQLRESARIDGIWAGAISSDWFRRQAFSEEAAEELRGMEAKKRGKAAGLYLLNKEAGAPGKGEESGRLFAEREELWTASPHWEEYLAACRAVWEDVRYFPVPASSSHPERGVRFVDSWMSERTFGGKRGHEGTDIMAAVDRPGLYPVVSMTDGTVTGKGWLPRGGYRLGIQAPSGAYFYYAHLDSYADLKEGDEVRAGDLLGFMGNSGYGPEGTRGMFATHLHVGIYLYPEGRETSVNPYWVLRMIEEKKLSCSF